jgi:NAD(P)-dependent dehydrogenase (short-subunit alcohol dehydrogenase family)
MSPFLDSSDEIAMRSDDVLQQAARMTLSAFVDLAVQSMHIAQSVVHTIYADIQTHPREYVISFFISFLIIGTAAFLVDLSDEMFDRPLRVDWEEKSCSKVEETSVGVDDDSDEDVEQQEQNVDGNVREDREDRVGQVRNSLKNRERILTPHQVYEQVRSRLTKNSIVGRQQTASCHELWQLERSNRSPPESRVSLRLGNGALHRCYSCGQITNRVNAVYVLCCQKCGEQFSTLRTLSRNLGGKVALVIGGRTKLGHQVALKLLEAGATVVVTTRFVQSAQHLFENYPHFASFAKRLFILPLDLKDVARGAGETLDAVREAIEFGLRGAGAVGGRLDILVNCAAQTIAVREQQSSEQRDSAESKNRYGDALFVDSQHANSWALGYEQVGDDELRDVIDVNAIAIDIVIKRMLPLLKRASGSSCYVVNVHAREGLQRVNKSASHYHTNMAKAALHMLTRMLIEQNLTTEEGKPFRIHGVCPGWFSVDEYYENGAPLPFAPLDEIDAASRVCYPIFAQLPSERRTRRHFTRFAT